MIRIRRLGPLIYATTRWVCTLKQTSAHILSVSCSWNKLDWLNLSVFFAPDKQVRRNSAWYRLLFPFNQVVYKSDLPFYVLSPPIAAENVAHDTLPIPCTILPF